MIDLDDFKQLNDSLGHPAGDRALVHVAEVVTNTLRPTDRVGRFGGEEFLILMPDACLEKAATAMARLQLQLAAQPLKEGAARIDIAFSCGVAERTGQEALERVVARADLSLYQAKTSGKNRVFLSR